MKRPQGFGRFCPEVQQWFQAVDKNKSGRISWEELQSGLGEHFSPTCCKLLTGMFRVNGMVDKDKTVFRNYDRDQSGSIEEQELSMAFQQMGCRFSEDCIKFLINRADLKNHKHISVDQFITVCVQIERLTEAFKAKGTEMEGIITVGFEEFITIALSSSV